jgi:hypothetical protein
MTKGNKARKEYYLSEGGRADYYYMGRPIRNYFE